jgi:HEAT repeat protein
VELLRMSVVDFQQVFGGTALERTGRDVMRRNAAIVLGNLRQLEGDAELLVALRDDSPLVRSAAGWALCRRGGAVGLAAVREQLLRECVTEVACDLRLSLEECG